MQNHQAITNNSALRLKLLALAIASPLAVSTAIAQIGGKDVVPRVAPQVTTEAGEAVGAEISAEAEAEGNQNLTTDEVEEELEDELEGSFETAAEARAEAEAEARAEARARRAEAARKENAMKLEAAEAADSMEAGTRTTVDTGLSAITNIGATTSTEVETRIDAGAADTLDRAASAENAARARADATMEVPASEAAAIRAESEAMADRSANVRQAMEGTAEATGKTATTTTLSTGTVVKSLLPTVSGDASADARVGNRAAVTMDADVGVSGDSDVFTGATVLKPLEKTTVDGYAALSGGIGNEETEAMKAARGEYNTRMTFATSPTGSYLPDVRVKIISAASGDLLLDAVSPGPLFYVQLPSGSYKVEASGYGEIKKKDFTVSSSNSADLLLQWPAQ